jgi:uncharacterized DUF497 family protein
MKEIFKNCEGFHWDKGNIEKNWIKHKVEAGECEEVFFNIPFIVEHDIKHSTDEERYFALGQTDPGRYLFIVFTIRKKLIRIISARDMNKKERKIYEKQFENYSKI